MSASRRAPRYLSQEDLREKGIRYHINHLRRMWKVGAFPKPVHLSKRKIVWIEADIDRWVASKAAV